MYIYRSVLMQYKTYIYISDSSLLNIRCVISALPLNLKYKPKPNFNVDNNQYATVLGGQMVTMKVEAKLSVESRL